MNAPVRHRRHHARFAVGFAVATLLLTGGSAWAQPAQSFTALRDGGQLEEGQKAVVEDTAGRRFRGRIEALEAGSLTLRIDSARERSHRVFTEADVTRIQRSGSRALPISAITGAGAALAVTAAAAAAYGQNEGGAFCGNCFVTWSVVTVPVGVGVGALIGFAIDRANVRTVYVRPQRAAFAVTPLIARRTMGGAVSIRF